MGGAPPSGNEVISSGHERVYKQLVKINLFLENHIKLRK
jgi:hypothetical protein